MLPAELGGEDVGDERDLKRGGHDVEEQRREDEVDGAVCFKLCVFCCGLVRINRLIDECIRVHHEAHSSQPTDRLRMHNTLTARRGR